VSGLRFNLTDLSPAMQAQVKRQLSGKPEVLPAVASALSKYANQKVIDPETKTVIASKREAKATALYREQLRGGDFAGLATQVWFQISGVIYQADFVKIDIVSSNKDGTVNAKLRVIDAKGHKTKEYQLKKKLMHNVLGIEIEEV
jgi:hypothetical protein